MKKMITLTIFGSLILCQVGFAATAKPTEQTGSLTVTPESIRYPAYTKPSTEKQYFIRIENISPNAVTFTSISTIEDSAKPSAPSGWMAYSSAPTTIPPSGVDTLIFELNNGAIVTSGPTRLFGKLRLRFNSSADSLDIPVDFRVVDTIVLPLIDSVTTQCGIRLAVASNGNLGNHAIGGANMGSPAPSPECDLDTGTLNPGDATIYLADASPVIVRHPSLNQYSASWSVYDGEILSPNGFKPLTTGGARGSFSGTGYDGFRSGTFVTADSLIKLERTVWAPTNHADSCHFMIMRTRIFPYTINMSVSNLAIGDFFDFDLPSDSGEIYNAGGTDPTRSLVYVRGFRSEDTAISNHACYPNGRRYAGAALIKMQKTPFCDDEALYGAYNAANDSFVYPSGTLVPEQLWANMQASGYSNEPRITDLHSVLIYKNSASNGYTLPANDTLTIYTAVAVVRPSGGTTANGLDTLKKEIDKALKWVNRPGVMSGCYCSCIGTTGNVNKGATETPDLTDLALLVAYLTTTPRPRLPSICEADINGDHISVDLSDLALLIAYLTQTPRPTLPDCW